MTTVSKSEIILLYEIGVLGGILFLFLEALGEKSISGLLQLLVAACLNSLVCGPFFHILLPALHGHHIILPSEVKSPSFPLVRTFVIAVKTHPDNPG